MTTVANVEANISMLISETCSENTNIKYLIYDIVTSLLFVFRDW